MGEFFIDKHGTIEEDHSDRCTWSGNDSDSERKNDIEQYLLDDLTDTFCQKETKLKTKKHSDVELEDSYITTNYTNNENKKESFFCNIDEILKNSAIKPGHEKLHSLPIRKSQRALKLERKIQREKTKGKKWFDMPATEITNEIKTDMQVLKMRSVLDRHQVYKKNNFTKVPKYFQVGTVVEGPADFYNGRIVKSQRKKTIVDELLADAECKNFQKKKFKEIVNNKCKRKRSKPNDRKNNKSVKRGKLKK